MRRKRAPGKKVVGALAVTSALILISPVLSKSYFQQRDQPLILPNQVQE